MRKLFLANTESKLINALNKMFWSLLFSSNFQVEFKKNFFDLVDRATNFRNVVLQTHRHILALSRVVLFFSHFVSDSSAN